MTALVTMNSEERLLADIPDHLCLGLMLKAMPSAEGNDRFIYFEASNEGLDQTGEIVMAKALEASADLFLKFGNIDIDHYTILGPKLGMKDSINYEIGRPVDVSIKGSRTFVKAQLYSGSGELARNANMVWESMTQLQPPARWYPSVGGAVLAKSVQIDPETKNKVGVVTQVRWTNVALSRTPVNQHLGTASTAPLATFAKSLNGLVMTKALEASYSTDVAQLTGGGALGMQSLDVGAPKGYFEFRNDLSGALCKSREDILQTSNAEELVAYSMQKFNLSRDEATEWVDRFLGDLKSGLNQRGSR